MNDALLHPELIPPKDLSICFGGGDFVKVGRALVGLMQQYAGLQPDSRVLDVGCGVGRIAFALAQFLTPQGSYDGFDNFPSGVEWCQEHYPQHLANFRFQHVGIFNALYYPFGDIKPSEFIFPYADNTFDLVVLNSVFTHMLPEDVMHYLDEIRRVMAPGGKCFISWFLVREEDKAYVKAGQTDPQLAHRFGGFYVQDLESMEDAVGYDERFALNLYARCELLIDEIIYGKWRGEPARTTQDIVIAGQEI